MAFTDDFNRSDENLEASASWTLIDGPAGGARVVSNVLKINTTNSVCSYSCPDQGSADHYTQAVWNTLAYGFTSIRLTDGNNFIGVRHEGTDWQVYKRDTGSFSLIGSYTVGLTGGDIAYLEGNGNDITLKVNGTTRVGPTSETFNNTETTQGVCPRSVVVTNWIDDFEAGALAAGGATGKSNPLSGPLGGCLSGPI
jgi:hypothetical protein